jgi:cyclomaltodextrinase / maltogenic alpha-amylase / neopullulanase
MAAPSTAIDSRAKDWRLGAVVYQIFPDRFAPSASLEAKRHHYKAPASLLPWTALPTAKPYDPKTDSYPHVFEFWGGDLASIRANLDYVQGLGVDILYLNPVFSAPSNHKYDTEDYLEVDPMFGTNEDLLALGKELRRRGMKIMLDGVFNHVGATNQHFLEALKNPKNPGRDWYFFEAKGSKDSRDYRGWAGVKSLPAYRLENPEVQDYLWRSRESVVQKWLRLGIDGWRLDVAFELGPDLLKDLTKHARKARKDALIVGEISGYPSEWDGAVDGVFNFHSMNIASEMVKGRIKGGQAGKMNEALVQDAGIENLLRSWLLTDNHDTSRFASVTPDPDARHLIRALQFTLPGSPCLYYGSELGMVGEGDPGTRAPMRWDLVTEGNRDLASTRQLLKVRKSLPALRYGDYLHLESDRTLAFARVTGRLEEAVVVLVNPLHQPVKEAIPLRLGRLMSWGEMQDQLSGAKTRVITGILDVEMKPRSVMILTPLFDAFGGYTPYQRILDSEKKKPKAAKP